MPDPVTRLNQALKGRYQIDRELGEGGMATVYLADDLKHERKVALKVLKPELAAVVGAERFLAEIKTTANLQHPHILPLFDSGEADSFLFYVMPHIQGESLREKLDREYQLPVDEAVRIATDVAEALDYAHRHRVIHRDIKPGNVLIHDGQPVISDFGIALAVGVAGGGRLTETGLSLGTPHYMSPEQATGDQHLGPATDIYALGCVLYEMLVGEPPYTGRTAQAVLGKIVVGETPSVSAERSSVPANVDAAIAKALEKVPADRFSTAAKFSEALADWSFGSDMPPYDSQGKRQAWVPSSRRFTAALTVLALMTVALWVGRGTAPTTGLRRPSEFVVSFEQEIAVGGGAGVPVPSPAGRYIVFRGTASGEEPLLWIRPLESAEARPLAGTEGSTGAIVWSPDGEWIGFFVDGRLMKIRPEGGPPQPIAELPRFQSADWGSQGDILFRAANRDPLYVIHESGGSPRQATQLNVDLSENSHRHPEFLPDGRRFLFVSRSAERGNNALYVASLDSPEVRRLMPAESQVSHVPTRGDRSGALFYYSEGALVARSFDADSETLIGEPTPVAEGVSYNAPSINAGFRVSQDGSVIIVRSAGGREAQLTWFRRDGEEIGTVGPLGQPAFPRISPNGETVLFTAPDPRNGNRDVWHTELARGITTKLTTHIANDFVPVWSPDGSQILFVSDRPGEGGVYLKTSFDPGVGEALIPGLERRRPSDWSLDGRWILSESALPNDEDIWVASLSGGVDAFPFLETPFREANGRFSPDGRWIAYVSNETGQQEVHVRPFEGEPAGTEGRIQISSDGGVSPVWGPEGRELFYMSEDVLYAVDTADLGGQASVSLPSRLFQACPDGRVMGSASLLPNVASYHTLDGERFLVSCQQEVSQFVVLLDWMFPE